MNVKQVYLWQDFSERCVTVIYESEGSVLTLSSVPHTNLTTDCI